MTNVVDALKEVRSMNKKVIPFIIAIPSLLLLLVFKIVPAINSLFLSLKKYSIFKGLWGSPNVGLKNYADMFNSVHFTRLFGNTFRLSFFSILFTCFFAILLIICISKMPNRIVKTISIVIISIPAFIPIASYTALVARVLSPDGGFINQIIMSLGSEPRFFLAENQYFSIIFALTDALRNVYIPVIIGVLVCEQKGINPGRIFMVIFIYALIRATLFFSPDLETLQLFLNPMVYEKGDVFDTYAYRTGLVQGNMSFGSAVWITKTIAQLLVNILIYFILYSVLPKLKGVVNTLTDKVDNSISSIISILGFVLLALGSIAITVGAFFPSVIGEHTATFGEIRTMLSNKAFSSAVFNSLIYCVFSCILYGFITITLAFPMTTKSKIYPIFLVLVMTFTNNIVGEYLVIRAFGLVNTYFAVILQTSISVIGAFALHFVVSEKFGNEVPTLFEYFKESLLPLVSIVGLFFIATWGGYLLQQITISKPNNYGMGLMLKQMLTQPKDAQELLGFESSEAMRSSVILLSSFIPVILGTVLICLNKILPLSAFSSQARKG